MPREIVFPVGFLLQRLGSRAVVAEPLLVPEIAILANRREPAVAATQRALIKFLARQPSDDYLRRRSAVTAREHRFTLQLPPPRANECWKKPVELNFHAVVWENRNLVLARVLALGIEIVAAPSENLDEVLRRESLNALRRLNLSTDLRSLSPIQVTTGFRIEWQSVSVPLPTLKERAIRADDDDTNKKTVLQEVATLLRPSAQPPAYHVHDAVTRLADALTAKPPQSVLLVGPSGVGKTALIRELVRRQAQFALADRPFYQTSGSRLVAGQCGFGMWEKRCQDLIQDATKRQAIVLLGSLVELMDVGKSEFNPTGIASFLRPAIARGELLGIAECTPDQLPLIEKENPQLPDAFRMIRLEEPDPARGLEILASFAADQGRRPVVPAALQAVDRLHRRYSTYSAYPGRPLRFLHHLIRDGEPGTPIQEHDVYARFTRETGLPREMIDPDEAFDLPSPRDWFSRTVVGQPEAVDLVVDLLATIKTGLTRVNRPIASLLFIGPTGVGKTELAKAIAEYLFGSRDRLTRFDMSEYADAVSVRRLVGTSFGTEGLLTARVREQPFSVLLLDEVEKAHPSAFDLLLQALGEARLTDAGGRLADFRNTVVILTSNLGAEGFRSGTPGFSPAAAEIGDAKAHFTKAVEKFLRPEMFNRLDRIVPFGSLPAEVIRQIADREWHKVLERDGLRFRDSTVTTRPGLLDHLATVGFDPRYGARPLKRAMEREILAPLARQLNVSPAETHLEIEVDAKLGQATATVCVRPKEAEQTPAESAIDMATTAQEQRNWHQLLQQSTVLRELENDITQLSHKEQIYLSRQKVGRKLTGSMQRVLAELGRLRELAAEVIRQREQAETLENEVLTAFYHNEPAPDLTARLATGNRDWDQLLLRLYAQTAPMANSLCLFVFSESRQTLLDMVSGYLAIARTHGFAVSMIRYRLPGSQPLVRMDNAPVQAMKRHPARAYWHENQLFSKGETPHKLLLWRDTVPASGNWQDVDDVFGCGLVFTGVGVHLRYSDEAGLHRFLDQPEEKDAEDLNALVVLSTEPIAEYQPPEKYTRKGSITSQRSRRLYHRQDGTAFDTQWSIISPRETLCRSSGPFAQLLERAVELTVRSRLMQMILS